MSFVKFSSSAAIKTGWFAFRLFKKAANKTKELVKNAADGINIMIDFGMNKISDALTLKTNEVVS